jgi:hypothetical protein
MWPGHSKHFPSVVGNTGNTPATVCNSRPLSAILPSHTEILPSHTAIFRYMAATLPATQLLQHIAGKYCPSKRTLRIIPGTFFC